MRFSKREQARLKNHYGPWALVTGASSGIGLELAERLAESGLNLILNSRNQDDLQKVANHLQSTYGSETKVIAADLSIKEGVQTVIAQSEGLDIGLIVLSAGFGTSGPFHQSDLEEEINMLRVNCEGLMILIHHFSQLFIEKKKGGMLLMSSMVGFQGAPYAANYAASKAYVQALGEGLAHELRPFGVDVLTAAPGPVASGFEKRANMKMDMSLKPSQVGIPILKALGRKSTVLPGFLTKFLVYSKRLLPRWGRIIVMKWVMTGMIKYQKPSF